MASPVPIARTFLLALVATAVLLSAACTDDGDGTTSVEDPTVRIGARDLGESAILAQIYGQVLEAEGYEVEHVRVDGAHQVLLAAFDNRDVNFSPEYAASLLEFLNGGAGEATGDTEETVGLLRSRLDPLGLRALTPAPAVDTNAFVVTEETAEIAGLRAISDIPADGGGFRLGAPQGCTTDPFCLPGLERGYGIDLSGDFVPLEADRVADALAAGDVDIGVLFSTNGRIDHEGWVLLDDDRDMLAADNVTPVISDELADAHGDDLVELVDEVSEALDTATLTELNRRSQVDGEDADAIAADFVADVGLG